MVIPNNPGRQICDTRIAATRMASWITFVGVTLCWAKLMVTGGVLSFGVGIFLLYQPITKGNMDFPGYLNCCD